MKSIVVFGLLIAVSVLAQEEAKCTWSTSEGTADERKVLATYNFGNLATEHTVADSESGSGTGSRNYMYRFFPCGRIQRPIVGDASKEAPCEMSNGLYYPAYQYTKSASACYYLSAANIAAPDTVHFSLLDVGDPSVGVSYHFQNGKKSDGCTVGRSLKLNIFCQDTLSIAQTATVQEAPMCQYNVNVYVADGCPTQCGILNGRVCGGRGKCGYDRTKNMVKCYCNEGFHGSACEKEGREGIILNSLSKALIVICVMVVVIEIGVLFMWSKVKNLRLDPEAYANLNSEKMGMIENLGS